MKRPASYMASNVFSSTLTDSSNQKRKALVMSNSYQYSDVVSHLPSRNLDFFYTKSKLENICLFEVTYVVLDGTIDNMRKTTQKFINSLNDNETSLFYFSGYGEKRDNSNVLYADNGLNMFNLDTDYISLVSQRKGLHIIVLDCCKTNHLGSSNMSFTAFPNSFILYSTESPPKTSTEIEKVQPVKNETSLFTRSLFLQIHHNPGMGIELLAKHARIDLAFHTNDKQIACNVSGLLCSFKFTEHRRSLI